ncbi:MAG: DUF927 domain-containing protein [Acetobacteraceae bacterium]|nr:DUF927 domain-containing protein [Acetobacteraceae bacterium]
MTPPNGGRPDRRKSAAAAALHNPTPARPGAGPFAHTEVPGFSMSAGGLFKIHPARDGKAEAPQFLCGAFEVLAEGRDNESESWSLLLRWHDRDGQPHEWICPRAMMAGDAAELRSRLAAGGLVLSPNPAARQALLEFLWRQQPAGRFRLAARCGWFSGLQGGTCFVLPHVVVGNLPKERVRLDAPPAAGNPYRSRGQLDAWRAGVAQLATGNRLLIFAISAAFAGVLLQPLGLPGGGFHLVGQSQRGKSTALRTAASVWGAPEGASAFLRSWRTTANALEGVAAECNDGCLVLDEIGEAEPREVGSAAYMLANGSGKGRASRDGRARQVATWSLLLLSAGERRMVDLIAEAKMQLAAGQEIRLVDVPADAGAGYGLFESLHGRANPGAFAEALLDGMRGHHGVAGPAFLSWLVPRIAEDPDWPQRELRPRLKDFLAEFVPPGADAQVRSVCMRFALVALAGELAAEAGVTGWASGAAWASVGACLTAWLDARGSTASREELEAVRRVAAVLAADGQARFEVWRDRHSDDDAVPDAAGAPHEPRAVMKRMGWRKWMPEAGLPGGGRWAYFFTAEGFREALAGLPVGLAAATLHRLGYMAPPRKTAGGKLIWSRTAKPPGFPNGIGCYEVSPAIMADPDATSEADG